MKPAAVLPFLLLLAACGGSDGEAKGERRTAAGEVLGGTISDDMLPLDTVTSQSPPLRETGAGGESGARGEATGGTRQAVDAAQPTPGPAPAEPAPSAAPEPASAEEAAEE